MQLDVEKFVSGLHEYMRAALVPIVKRLEAVESRAPERGEPGKDAEPVDVSALVSDILRQIPTPKNGDDGKDGRDGPSLEDVVQAVMPSVQKQLEALPKPKDGQDGKSITLDDVLPTLKSMQAEWALNFERRAQDLFQKAIDNMPKPKDGRDGVDGIGWDDMSVEHDGKRGFAFKLKKGDVERVSPFKIDCVLDAGFFKEGNEYETGDGVTFGGSYWIAKKNTTAKPEVGSDDWRLAVRRGRDAKSSARID